MIEIFCSEQRPEPENEEGKVSLIDHLFISRESVSFFFSKSRLEGENYLERGASFGSSGHALI